MKVRKNAKRILENFRKRRAFLWSTEHLASFIHAKMYALAKQIADAPYTGEYE